MGLSSLVVTGPNNLGGAGAGPNNLGEVGHNSIGGVEPIKKCKKGRSGSRGFNP
jgi:hypothetical protein